MTESTKPAAATPLQTVKKKAMPAPANNESRIEPPIEPSIELNGTSYPIETLSDEVKSLISLHQRTQTKLAEAQQELAEAQQEVAICQLAINQIVASIQDTLSVETT